MSLNTIDLRRAAIRYLHFIAGCAVPTVEARVSETVAGMRREPADKGEIPNEKLAATAGILHEIISLIGDDLAGLRDKVLLTLGFAGALRRAKLATVRVEHIEARDRSLRVTLPRSKGERTARAVTVALPYGTTALCRVRTLRRWQAASAISEGALFRRILVPPTRRKGDGPLPALVVGTRALDSGSIARIVKQRAAAAGYDPDLVAGHSLKRGGMTTGMDQGVHPTNLKRLGRHKSYNVLDKYLEAGDPFERRLLGDVL